MCLTNFFLLWVKLQNGFSTFFSKKELLKNSAVALNKKKFDFSK